MKLKFRARPAMSCAWPNSHFAGQPRRFVGRDFVAGDEAKKLPASYRASAEPSEVDAADAAAEHLTRKCRKGELWAADVETAAACGVEFVDLAKGDDGEWFPSAKKQPTASQKRADKE
jgi:hypothetical protein